jgi:uncharacterized membrane protein YeaQ/YmgE (transglycosylase-associated protein family)
MQSYPAAAARSATDNEKVPPRAVHEMERTAIHSAALRIEWPRGYATSPAKKEDRNGTQAPGISRAGFGWPLAVQTDGTQRADSLHDKKSDAMMRARKLAGNKATELVIKNERGSIVGKADRLLGVVGAFLAVIGYANYSGMNISPFRMPSEAYAIACTVLGALMMLLSFGLVFRNVYRVIAQARAEAQTDRSHDPRRTDG